LYIREISHRFDQLLLLLLASAGYSIFLTQLVTASQSAKGCHQQIQGATQQKVTPQGWNNPWQQGLCENAYPLGSAFAGWRTRTLTHQSVHEETHD